jgi:AcrR family transcriptional regulator
MTLKSQHKGRPRSDPDTQRVAIFNALSTILMSSGYQNATTLSIAKACGISKNTLYNHFPSKEALFIAFVENRAATMNEHLGKALEDSKLDLEHILRRFGCISLGVLSSDISVAINRAAISAAGTNDLDLSFTYFNHGHEPVRQKVVALLERAGAAGVLVFDDIDETFQSLIGLLYGDFQMRRLLGVMSAPNDKQIADKVDDAIKNFMKLYAP